MNRRGFLRLAMAALAVPALIRLSQVMPIEPRDPLPERVPEHEINIIDPLDRAIFQAMRTTEPWASEL